MREDRDQEQALYLLTHGKWRSRYHIMLDLMRRERFQDSLVEHEFIPDPPPRGTLTAPEAAAHYRTLYPEYSDEMLALQ